MAGPVIIATKDDLVAAFRRIDRKDVEFADDLAFPLRLIRVVTWCQGTRSYLVFRDPEAGAARAIVFRRTPAAGPPVATMCDWCRRMRRRGDVQLLSARVTTRRTIGQYLCGDLSCFDIEGAANSAYEPPDGAVHRVERAFERMHTLVSQRLS